MGLIARTLIETRANVKIDNRTGNVKSYDLILIKPGEKVLATESLNKAEIERLKQAGKVIDESEMRRVELPPPLDQAGTGLVDEAHAS